jgi:hypothetical protein
MKFIPCSGLRFRVKISIMVFDDFNIFKLPDASYVPTINFFIFTFRMRPDYPHKIFPDIRNHFFLLMETLAMDAR